MCQEIVRTFWLYWSKKARFIIIKHSLSSNLCMICQNFVRKFGSLRISSYLCGRRIIRIKGSCVWNSTYIAALYTVRSVSLRGTTTDNRIILLFLHSLPIVVVVRAVRQCSAYHAQQQSVFIVYIYIETWKSYQDKVQFRVHRWPRKSSSPVWTRRRRVHRNRLSMLMNSTSTSVRYDWMAELALIVNEIWRNFNLKAA